MTEVRYTFDKLNHTLLLHSCVFGSRPAGVGYKRHRNRMFELFACREGEVVARVGRRSRLMRAGDWACIRPGVGHEFFHSGDGAYTFFHLHFDIDDQELRARLYTPGRIYIEATEPAAGRLDECAAQIERLLPPGWNIAGGDSAAKPDDRRKTVPSAKEEDAATNGAHAQTEESAQALKFEITARGIHTRLSVTGRLALQAHVLLLIRELTEALGSESSTQPALAREGASPYRTELAQQIEEQLGQLVQRSGTIKDVASGLGISEDRMAKVFRSVYGISPRQYVSEHKLAKARELLISTTLPVGAIATRLGFGSPQHFSRQFRRWTGAAPGSLRPSTPSEERVTAEPVDAAAAGTSPSDGPPATDG
ncbi:helix-turn-helix domain-containing protein [Paenibacillus sp. IB182496]|uniref:Helix-turn-helix domain-containing protein n=1 Tax=Paenibacillus sabuli TaxID=2772509 RepID=A0A927GTX5_9BACL|nr:helix-turn-helix domain-containing protein [Paenibacillus sabuli]MBD2847545.1 helix-turn-helix domain-containing protein [Paenibacillus sabuli]